MGKITIPLPVKLVIGLIYRDVSVKDRALRILKERFGEIDFLSQELPFDYTCYYYPEFGKPLKRIFVSFKRLYPEDSLANIKVYTNTLEKRFSLNKKRQINIDPGLLNLGKVILATTKDFVHRIYLGKGIFAEVTLFYKNGTFSSWQWTYPDYQSRAYRDIFNTIRVLYQEQIKHCDSSIPEGVSRRKTPRKS